jgi:hypothetical protein
MEVAQRLDCEDVASRHRVEHRPKRRVLLEVFLLLPGGEIPDDVFATRHELQGHGRADDLRSRQSGRRSFDEGLAHPESMEQGADGRAADAMQLTNDLGVRPRERGTLNRQGLRQVGCWQPSSQTWFRFHFVVSLTLSRERGPKARRAVNRSFVEY